MDLVKYIYNKPIDGGIYFIPMVNPDGVQLVLEGVKNYSIAVKEKGEDIIFLRKIIPGGTDESYGVHVAKLAGVPQDVVKRSNEILKTLERKSILGKKNQEKENKKIASGQLDMFNYKIAELAHEIDKINLNEEEKALLAASEAAVRKTNSILTEMNLI